MPDGVLCLVRLFTRLWVSSNVVFSGITKSNFCDDSTYFALFDHKCFTVFSEFDLI